MKVTSLRYLDAKFHHPSLGASPSNSDKTVFACLQNITVIIKTLVIIKTAKRK